MKAALVFVALLTAAPAEAALTQNELSQASLSLPPGAHLDTALAARDTDDRVRTMSEVLGERAAFLTFADYTCNTLCGTDIQLLSAAIERAQLKPDSYRLVVVGIDPKDSIASARKMLREEVPPGLRQSTVFLLPDEVTVGRATGELGFHYVYDKTTDQFAHPAAVYVIAPDGAVRSVLSPFDLNLTDMRSLLTGIRTQASGLYERIHLLCYGYDPVTGIYSLRIDRVLKAAGVLTVLLLSGAVFLFIRAGRKTA